MSGHPRATTIDEMLADARSHLARVEPTHLWDEVAAGALLVDIRPGELRARDGALSGAEVIGLNVLEWRLAPSSRYRSIEVDAGRRVILVCDQGYSSSLAARRLQMLGLEEATDLAGGFQALKVAGLVEPPAGLS